jgi:hypothetical protein
VVMRLRWRIGLRWLLLTSVSVAWGVLFYRNYWNAAVPAFGEISIHLIRLRYVLWRYVGFGTIIAGMWGVVVLRQRIQEPADAKHERMRHRGT